eukprot:s7855_g10.t1
MGRSTTTICCHQLAVLGCQRCEKVRFVATSLCSIVKDGKKYDLLPQFVPACQRWEEVRFVATSLRSIVKDGKKYDLLPPVCARRWEEVRFVQFVLKDGKKYDLLPPVCSARLSKMGRSTICCHQFVLDCQRWEKVRFFATSLCSLDKDKKKYDLLPPVCAQRWEEVRFVATSLRCSIVKDGKKYEKLPPVCAPFSKMGRSTILLPTVCAGL